MWESADHTPPAVRPPAPPRAAGGVLGAQILVCALALAGVLVLRAVQPALFAALRVAYTAAVTASPDDLFSGERRLERFVQQTAAAFEQAAAEVLAQLFAGDDPVGAAPPAPSPPPTAAPAPLADPFVATRAVRGKAAPAGASLQSYRPPFALTFPLPGGAWAATSGYGWRTEPVSGSGADFHKGADLAAAEGTPVLAAGAGIVRSAGKSESYGNWLRILHPGGDETLYAHLQYLFVHAGQSVAAGAQLGTVGRTGHVTGAHLHFELLHEGVRYDPSAALQAAL